MKLRTFSKLAFGGLLAASVGAAATSANATPYLYVQVLGGSVVSINPGSSYYVGLNGGNTVVSATSFAGDIFYFANISVTSNSPGGIPVPGVSYTATATNSVSLLTNTANSLNVFSGSGGFITPSIPPNGYLDNSVGESRSTVHAGDGISAWSCVEPGSATCSYNPATATPVVHISATQIQNEQGGDSATTITTAIGTPYSIGNVSTVALGTKNDTISYTVTSTLTSVPEPISMTLMGTGLLGLSAVYRRRRRV